MGKRGKSGKREKGKMREFDGLLWLQGNEYNMVVISL